MVGLLVPGWCLVTLLGLKALSPALAITTAIGMGLAVVSVAAWTAWLTGTGMVGAAVLTLLVTAGALVARIIWRRRATSMERPGLFDLGAGTLAAITTGFAVYTGPWLGQSADPFYHMAAALTLLRENLAIPQEVFFGVTMPYPDVTSGTLHLALAWVSLVAGMIPAWTALTFFGAAFTTICLAAFGRELTGSALAGLVGAALYIVLELAVDMRAAGYPNRIAPGLVWLSFTFMLRFTRSSTRSWRELVPACLLAFTAASVYSGMAPLLVVMVLATFVAAAVVAALSHRLRSLVPLAIACAAAMLLLLPLLVIRLVAALPTPGPEASLATQAAPLLVHMRFGYSLIDPGFWFGGWITMITLGTICLLGRARRVLLDGDPGAALLWGCSLFVPLAGLTPLFTGVASGPYFFKRIAQLLVPIVLITIGWELSRLPGFVRLPKIGPQTHSARRLLAAYLLAGFTFYIVGTQIQQVVLPRYTSPSHLTNSVSTSLKNNLTVNWADRLQALDTAGPGAILADPESGYELAGLTGRRIVAVPSGHGSYQDEAKDGAMRRGDVADALDPSGDPTTLLSVLFRYQVTFVIVDLVRDGPATWAWIAGQQALTTVGEGSGWRLYRFDPNRIDTVLDIPMHGGVGAFPSRVIAGRAVFVRVTSPGPNAVAQVTAVGLTSGSRYQMRLPLPAQAGATATAPLLLPDAAQVDRYSITVTVPGAGPLPAGEVEVGHAYEAEFFSGVIFDLSHGYARQPGWTTVDDPAFHRGEAAVALRAGSVASYPLAERPGEYCLALSVFDAGDGHVYTLKAALAGAAVSATWTGTVRGVRELEMTARTGTGSRQLTYWVPKGAALGEIVDRITLYPPPSTGACTSVSS